MQKNVFQIAIDGPVSAGKGTVSKLIAQELQFLYIDTGAMYRMATLLALQEGISIDDEGAIVAALKKADMQLTPEGRFLLDGKDVSQAIRTYQVSQNVAKVARLAEVRKTLVAKQQAIAKEHSVVMEGRDITFRVLPQANLKIYLDASVETRAKRRHLQLLGQGETIPYAEVRQSVIERDEIDMHRATDPLHVATDAWVLDTSDLSIQEVVDTIVAKVKKIQDAPGNQ